jgi:hypothetical protein
MPPRYIPPDHNLSVIDDWLDGETRKDIARKHVIGNGTVYNYVHKWSNSIGFEKAAVLRDLAVKLKKNGLTVADCAKGFRMVMVFEKYGIKEDEEKDEITNFLKDIYLNCQKTNLSVQKVFMYIYDIINFSKEIAISQIPDFMKKKMAEKERLEISINKLTKKIKELENIKIEKDQEIQNLTELVEKMSSLYNLFINAKYKLDKYRIDMRNFNQFANCIVGIAKENYDVTKVIERMSDYDNLVKYIQQYKNEIEVKKAELNKLIYDINYYIGLLNTYTIKINVLEKLEIMSFGINELQVLYDTLIEIDRENKNKNNKSFDEIKKEFFYDLKNYYKVVGSRNERDRLQAEIKNLETLKIKERERYHAYPTVIKSLERLSNAEIYEDDIIMIDKIISIAGIGLYKDKQRYKLNLIDNLQKYGNLKLAIKNLEDGLMIKSRKKKTHYKTRGKKSSSIKESDKK